MGQVLQRLVTLNGVWIAGNHDTKPFRRTFTGEGTGPDRLSTRWTRDQISGKGGH